MKSRILIIDGEAKRAHQFSYCIGQSNDFETFALIHNRHSDNLKYSRFVSKVITHNHCGEDYLALIIENCKQFSIDLIFGLSIPAIDFLITHEAELSKYATLQLIPDRKAFDLTNDKEQLAIFLKQNNLNVPLSWSADAYENRTSEINFPVLLKPKKGEGGKGIFKCDDQEELDNTLKTIQTHEYLIQNYIQGYDIDCSILANKGKIITHTIQRGVEESKYNAFSPYSIIEFLTADKLYKLVEDFIKKVNYTGIGHLDLRFDETTGEYVIIEINTRYWDTLIGSFLVARINFPNLHALHSKKSDEKIPAGTFETGLFLTANAYFLHQTHKLKIKLDQHKIHLKNSGAYVQLTDPMYFAMSYFRKPKALKKQNVK